MKNKYKNVLTNNRGDVIINTDEHNIILIKEGL